MEDQGFPALIEKLLCPLLHIPAPSLKEISPNIARLSDIIAMNKTLIYTTARGEELVLLSRRDYDAMLARLGDEEAEDRMTERLVDEARERIASGEEDLVRAGADGRPPRVDSEPFGQAVRRLRKEQGRSQQELAAIVEITQGS
jgi:PHD/YefM family antitoxin component YafN of YafNO toxin-antitoxin module